MARLTFLLGLTVAALIVLVFSIGVAFEAASWDRIKPGVSVLGIGIGELTSAEAAARLRPRTAAILDQPLQLEFGDRSWTTSPRALGLRLDPADLAEDAYRVGRQGSLLDQIHDQLQALQVGTDVPVIRTTDQSELDAMLQRISADLDKAPLDAHLELTENGTVVFSESQPGLQLDKPESRAALAQALVSGTPVVPLVTHTLLPAIATEQVADAHAQLLSILGDNASIEVRGRAHIDHRSG